MAQMSEEELAGIISRDKPGFKVIKREPATDTDDMADASPLATGVERVRDLSDLRRRYLGADEEGAEGEDARAVDDESDTQDEIVVIGPEEGATDPFKPGPGPKSVVVSGKERRVVAEQG
jgi:hypothetical protein